MINPRKLAAIDIAFLGSKFIISEFAVGVLLCPLLGAATLKHARSFWQLAFGLYLICLGVNYLPMLVYAIDITMKQSARAELGRELTDHRRALSKYRRQSLFLLMPLFVPLIALIRRSLGDRSRA